MLSATVNIPERSEAYILGDNERKLEYKADEKVPNAGTIVMHKEDHTLGNMVKMQLLRDPKVMFAGYNIPHPLINDIILKVRTSPDGEPMKATKTAVDDLHVEVGLMANAFKKACEEYQNPM